jgi:hypothetical protein
MFETICTLPLTADLFAQALHPREPVLSVGLATGHVQTLRLPSDLDADENDEGDKRTSIGSNDSRRGRGQIATQWRTRRHKVSCRTLGFSADGATLYSGGGDAIVKAACAETGQVDSKIVVANPYVLPSSFRSLRRNAVRGGNADMWSEERFADETKL